MNLAQIDRFSSFTMNFIPHDTQTVATMYWVLHTILAHFDKTNGKKPQIYAAQFAHKLHHPQSTSNTHKSDLYSQKNTRSTDFHFSRSHHTWFELIKYKAKNIYYFFLNNTDGR